MKPNEVYDGSAEVVARAATDLTLEGPRVLIGQVVRLETFYVADLTTPNKVLRLGYDERGTQRWLKRENAGVYKYDANYAYKYGIAHDMPLILVETERPIAMVESPTAGDTCVMIARGIIL